MVYLQQINKQYGSKILFENVNFHLRPNERVGLVGENGTGKTTLFRIITGRESADSGQVIVRKGARVAFLEQELSPRDETILERAVLGDGRFNQVKSEMEHLEKNTSLHQDQPQEWGRRYGGLQHEFERLGGYDREYKAKTILSGLGFHADQMDRPLDTFSGGWRMRVELARLLMQSPDVLLLDEPTNHFDLRSVEWLEGYLKTYEGALLVISHDRRFLNALAQRTVELDRGQLTSYAGNYDFFETEKRAREEQLESEAANQKRRIAEIERFIERFRAKNTKATQVQSRIKMLAKMERVETRSQTKAVRFRFPQPVRTGRIVIDLKNIDMGYGQTRVYSNFSTHLERGWKVALVGDNGAGKSTLLKLMAAKVEHQNGEIRLGTNVTRAYYAQHHVETLNPDITVLESMDEVAGSLSRTHKQTILGGFLFSGDDANKKVSVLSGGERSRLALARMLASPASLLLLDEPTNHLDMRSCEVLAAALADFEGSLCTISHDRYFLDGIINRVWEVENGTVREYVGNYSDYEWAKAREAKPGSETPVQDESAKPSASRLDRERKRREAEERNNRHRQLKPLQTRLQKVERRLEQVMEDKSRTELVLADPAIYEADQKNRLLEHLDRQKTLASEENDLLHEWDELSQAIERISTPASSQ